MSRIAATGTDGENLYIFIKDLQEITEVKAYIGQRECENISHETIREAGIQVRTLVLIDNSISIPEESRKKAAELLEGLVTDEEPELFSLGTLSESIHILCDWTDNQEQLLQTLEALEYQDQETYLTDALYDYLKETSPPNFGEHFERILLITDGVDNKAIGYTTEELLASLKETAIPIYTVGIYNSRKDNSEDLEHMFSISRVTQAESYLLEELEMEPFLEAMRAEWEDYVLTIPIPYKLRDGSTQTLTVRLATEAGEETLSFDDFRMPLEAEEGEEAPEEMPKEEEELSEISEPEREEPEKEELTEKPMTAPVSSEGNSFSASSALIAGVFVLAFVLLFLILQIKKRKKNRNILCRSDINCESAEQQEVQTEIYIPGELPENDNTIIMTGENSYRIMLTDTRYPERVYQRVVGYSLVIGSAPDADICIDYDRTVSRKQCEIVRSGDVFYIINHSNSNITLLDGQMLDRECWIYSGCTITMGRVEMRVDIWQE